MNIMFDSAIVNVNNVIEGNFLKNGGFRTFYNQGMVENYAGIVKNNFNAIIGHIMSQFQEVMYRST